MKVWWAANFTAAVVLLILQWAFYDQRKDAEMRQIHRALGEKVPWSLQDWFAAAWMLTAASWLSALLTGLWRWALA